LGAWSLGWVGGRSGTGGFFIEIDPVGESGGDPAARFAMLFVFVGEESVEVFDEA
jgi:hypothetical protein